MVKINLSEHIKELRPLQWTTQVALNDLSQEAAQVHCLNFVSLVQTVSRIRESETTQLIGEACSIVERVWSVLEPSY